MTNQAVCNVDGCKRVAFERCNQCWQYFCPFHLAKLHQSTWSNRKHLQCKKCYNMYVRTGYRIDRYPDRFPLFPEYDDEGNLIPPPEPEVTENADG